MPAPDTGYAPTQVRIDAWWMTPDEIGDVASITVPYGQPYFTDQFVADVAAALGQSALAANPTAVITHTDFTYSGQATVTVQGETPEAEPA